MRAQNPNLGVEDAQENVISIAPFQDQKKNKLRRVDRGCGGNFAPKSSSTSFSFVFPLQNLYKMKLLPAKVSGLDLISSSQLTLE